MSASSVKLMVGFHNPLDVIHLVLLYESEARLPDELAKSFLEEFTFIREPARTHDGIHLASKVVRKL
jgi:hypothetical protein